MNKLIAIVGMAGSGKSIITDYLESKGFEKIYFGGVMLDELEKRNLPINPINEKMIREKLREEQGMGVVAKLLLPKIKDAYQKGNTVLDGLYSWDEYVILKEIFKDNLNVVCLITNKPLRYERIEKRPIRPFTKENIMIRDYSEITNLAKGGPIAIADYYILNNEDKENSWKQMDYILKEITEREKDIYEKIN